MKRKSRDWDFFLCQNPNSIDGKNDFFLEKHLSCVGLREG
jgi:hypothetical protein